MKEIFMKYSNDRALEYQIKTIIEQDDEGILHVCKQPYSSEAENHIALLHRSFCELKKIYEPTRFYPNKCYMDGKKAVFDYVDGVSLEETLDDYFHKHQYDKIIELINEYADSLRSMTGISSFTPSGEFERVFGECNTELGYSGVPVANIDMIFANILQTSEGWCTIDYEWTYHFSVPVEFILYRAIYYYVHGSVKREDLVSLNIFQLMGISEEMKADCERMERHFQEYISQGHVSFNMRSSEMIQKQIDVVSEIGNYFKDQSYMEIYFDYGNGFSEEHKRVFYFTSDKMELRVPLEGDVIGVRIDPLERMCLVRVNNLYIEGAWNRDGEYSHNGCPISHNEIFFSTSDPQIILENTNSNDYYLNVDMQVVAINGLQLEALERLEQGNRAVEDYKRENQSLLENVQRQSETICILNQENMILENEKKNLRNEKVLFENEKVLLQNEKVLLEKEREILQNEKIVLQNEKIVLQNEINELNRFGTKLKRRIKRTLLWRCARKCKGLARKIYHKLRHLYENLNTNASDTTEMQAILERPEILGNDFDSADQMTNETVMSEVSLNKERIIVVVHEAQPAGAAMLSLNIVQTIKRQTDYEPIAIILRGGPLEENFQKECDTYCLGEQSYDVLNNSAYLDEVLAKLAQEGVSYVMCNSVVTGITIPFLKKYNYRIIAMVHEMPTSIATYNFTAAAENIAIHAEHVIFAAKYVRDAFVRAFDCELEKCEIIQQGMYTPSIISYIEEKKTYQEALKERLNLDDDDVIVMGCGVGNFRKGLDLFGKIALCSMLKNEKLHFVWLGAVDNEFKSWINNDLEKQGLLERMHWLPFQEQPAEVFAGADIYALTSREDPYPSVVMEAMAHFTPVIAFAESGGAPEAIADGGGKVVPYGDCEAFAESILSLAANNEERLDIARHGKQFVSSITPKRYIRKLIQLLCGVDIEPKLPENYKKVSVIIPNYNYERYLKLRIDSIVNQTYPPYEIIFLDDCSPDNSVEVAKKILEEIDIPYQIVPNTVNNGCFRQWLKGISLAKGDYVWVAEADDLCEPDFLQNVMPAFEDDEVNLSYAQSEVIYDQGEHSGYIYTEYTKEIDPVKWSKSYVNRGASEIIEGLGIQNTIPNASGVVMRKSAFEGIEEELSQYAISGDWFAYVYLIRQGKIAFCSKVLNYHRRHRQSIIARKEQDIQLFVELLRIKRFIADNYLIPETIAQRFTEHVKKEYIRLSANADVVAFDDHKELVELQNDIEKRVKDKIEKYSFLKNKEQKPILFVMPDFGMGGGQTLVVRLANFFARFYPTYLYNARPWIEEERILRMIDEKVHILPANGDPQQLKGYIEQYHIAMINSHIWWSDKIVYQALQEKKTAHWTLSMHGCYEALLDNPEIDSFFSQNVSELLDTTDNIIYATDKNKQIFEETHLDQTKTSKIHYGYEIQSIPTVNRREVGISDNSFVFGLVARGIKEKGFGEAAEAFASLCEISNREMDLVLIGNGEYIDSLKEQYAGNQHIHFIDNLSKPSEWIGWVKIFDVAMLPSYFISESLPNSVIEYLAYHKPVIATDIGDIKYMLRSGTAEAGILLPLHDWKVEVEELKGAMETMVCDNEKYQQYQKGTEILFEQYDMKNFAQRYFDMFLE